MPRKCNIDKPIRFFLFIKPIQHVFHLYIINDFVGRDIYAIGRVEICITRLCVESTDLHACVCVCVCVAYACVFSSSAVRLQVGDCSLKRHRRKMKGADMPFMCHMQMSLFTSPHLASPRLPSAIRGHTNRRTKQNVNGSFRCIQDSNSTIQWNARRRM